MKLILLLSILWMSYSHAITCEGYFKDVEIQKNLNRFTFGSEGLVLNSHKTLDNKTLSLVLLRLIGNARSGSTVRVIIPKMEVTSFNSLMLYKMILETFSHRNIQFEIYLGSRKASKGFIKFLTESSNFKVKYAIRDDISSDVSLARMFQIMVETTSGGVSVLRFEMNGRDPSQAGEFQVLQGQYLASVTEFSNQLNSLYTYPLHRTQTGLLSSSAWVVERHASILARELYREVYKTNPSASLSAVDLLREILK